MKKETQQLLFAVGLSGFALYLLATKSGQGVSSQISTGIQNMLTSRGIRNNNPGNIRLQFNADNSIKIMWHGQVPVAQQTDASFVQFISPEYGIRAIAKIMASYAARGLNTVASIINTWAPPTENDTTAYIQAVANSMGVDPNATLSVSDDAALIAAIVEHENGSQPYSTAQIDTGISMA